jgi:hypothetical protein
MSGCRGGWLLVGACVGEALLLSSCGGGTARTAAPAASARPAAVPVAAAANAARAEDKTVREVCDEIAAGQRKLKVRCPSTRLDDDVMVSIKRDSTFVAPRHRPFYSLSLRNDAAPLHVVFGGGSPHWFRKYVLDPSQGEGEGGNAVRRVSRRRVGRRTADVYKLPTSGGGINSGHVLLVLTRGGSRYFASVHGRDRAAAAAELLKAMS